MTRKIFYLALLLAAFPCRQGWAWTLDVETPPYAELRSAAAKVESQAEKGNHRLEFPEPPGEAELDVRGPLGGRVAYKVSPNDAGKTLRFDTAIVGGDDPNPPALSHLPALCPRLEGRAAEKGITPRYLYRGEGDSLNRFPITQLSDPDKNEGRQAESVRLIDGKNVLMLKAVRLTYDYEDDAIVDERRLDPKTGNEVEVREGRGGFYANFHYAVVPYDPAILALPEQSLLHLAQGSLKLIGQSSLRPALRTHGFLPGPFLSRSSFGYSLCEWGDTARQAPEQSLEYEGIALWDWDYAVSPGDRVLLIVWEGDEEDKARAHGLIGRDRLIDDLVGVFEVSRNNSLSGVKLRNSRGDFEIAVQTGDLQSSSPPASEVAARAQSPLDTVLQIFSSSKPPAAMTGGASSP